MFFSILLLAGFLFGLSLLALGVILLIKVKNKLPGLLTIAAGLAFTMLASLIFLSLVITTSVQG